MRGVLSIRAGLALVGGALLCWGTAVAQISGTAPSLAEWLMRVHQAARQNAYTGTFVVMAGDTFASAKIWHVCDGSQQLERVVSLSGTQRMTYRRNAHVITFFPLARRAVVEHRESLDLFSDRLKATDASIAEFYQFQSFGVQRIAGFDADVVRLVPKDRWRYGFTVWSERNTGLVLQLQTHDLDGRVLEQAAFSELQMNAPVDKGELIRSMEQTNGYQVERPMLLRINAEDQGWILRRAVNGFKSVRCYQRPVALPTGIGAGDAQAAVQWVFSDGLATVSLFMEPFDPRRHLREGAAAMGGATHTVARRVIDWWITAVGEVPVATLDAFVQGLERKQ